MPTCRRIVDLARDCSWKVRERFRSFENGGTGKPGGRSQGTEVTVSIGALIAILVVLVVLAVVVAVARGRAVRRPATRRSLGPEYNRLAEEVGTRAANAEYDKRRRRVDGLDIKPLSPERRTEYNTQWEGVQDAFIDKPIEAVRTAARLVTAVAVDRGYEVADADHLLVDLSVYYGDQLDGYRSALAVTEAADEAATEKLRQALLDYRAMFRELAEISDSYEASAATTRWGRPARPAGDLPRSGSQSGHPQSVPRPRSS